MKFKLDEKLTLEEKKLVENGQAAAYARKYAVSNPNSAEGKRVIQNAQKMNNKDSEEFIKSISSQRKGETSGEFNSQDKAILKGITDAGYSKKDAIETVKASKQSGNEDERARWENRFPANNGQQQPDDMTVDDVDKELKAKSNTVSQQDKESSTDQDPSAIREIDSEEIPNVGNQAEKVLSVLAKNKAAYNAFMSAIKGNIENQNYPFVKLLNEPKFADAIGMNSFNNNPVGAVKKLFNKSEGLHEAAGINFKAGLDTWKKEMGTQSSGNKILSKAKQIGDSKNISKNILKVYNLFVKFNDLITKYNYVDSGDLILFNKDFYKLNNNQMEKALNIDLASVGSNKPEIRDELQDNLKNIDRLQDYKFKNFSSGDEMSDENILKSAFKLLKANPDLAKSFFKQYKGEGK